MEKQEVKAKAILAGLVHDGNWEMRMRGLSDNLAHPAGQSVLGSYGRVISEARGTAMQDFPGATQWLPWDASFWAKPAPTIKEVNLSDRNKLCTLATAMSALTFT